MILEESAPGCIRTPFVILVDQQEKAPFCFAGLRARSFVDKDMREYHPVRTERRYLGIGMGDYSLDGFEGRIAIERKSMSDFQGTLLGWPADVETVIASRKRREINRRGRFKRELRNLQAMEVKAVIVEATLGQCIDECPQWGERPAEENAKLLYATYLSWQQQFRVPFIFCDDREMAAVTTFRILEQFWDRHRREIQRARATNV
jgi:hypothetical protein